MENTEEEKKVVDFGKEFTAAEKEILINSLDNTIAGITDAILKTKDESRKQQLREYLKSHQDVQARFI